MGLLFYSLCFLSSVRVSCGLYPHGLTVLLSWFSSLCESPLRTVSTRGVWCFILTCQSPLRTVSTCGVCLLFPSVVLGSIPVLRYYRDVFTK